MLQAIALDAWTDTADEELARRVRGGETALYEVLMRRYNQRLYRVARGIVRNEAEAEDVVQQAYVNAYLHLGQFAGRARFSTWLTRIAVYEALGRLRRRKRSPVAPHDPAVEDSMDSFVAAGISPEQEAFAGELRGVLEEAIDALPDGYRSVFVLRELEGLSTAETADCLEASEEAVKTRLHRAKAMLRHNLYERAGLASGSVFAFHLSRCDKIVATVLTRITAAS